MQSSKNRRGGTLWRSARERKAWLKDARRALESQEISCAAYIASIMVDRFASGCLMAERNIIMLLW